ncbi:MAG: ABC transporter permease subunit [Alphaproteobacteria bacterium]|nr:ABC transporter permease subunit [Alphaproteobacteria bacterium]
MKDSTRLQLASVVVFVAVLEAVCRVGLITPFTMIPPSQMATGLYRALASGSILPDMRSTLVGVVVAGAAAIVSGVVAGAVVFALPRVRRTLDPLFTSYYAVPIWAFYPVFVYLFGLTDTPKIVIGYLYAVVAMIVNTLNGLDRVPRVFRKTATVMKLGRAEALLRVVLPSAVPHIFTGVKLAISYAFIGVVGSEFILASSGLGHQIHWAYTSFDNDALYSMVLFIVLLAVAINVSLSSWEGVLMRRRGRS